MAGERTNLLRIRKNPHTHTEDGKNIMGPSTAYLPGLGLPSWTEKYNIGNLTEIPTLEN